MNARKKTITMVLSMALGAACASSAETPAAPASSPSSTEPTGPDGAASAQRADASDADEATPAIDPATACEPVLAAPKQLCKYVVADNPPVVGGSPPDGVYDLVSIVGPFPQVDPACEDGELRLERGIYQYAHHQLGGPWVAGGSFRFDTTSKRMHFDVDCGRPLLEDQPYSWDPSEKTLTIFSRDDIQATPWVFALRR